MAEEAHRRGVELPEEALPPDPDPWLGLYWKAWEDLSTMRPGGWSEVAPIPWKFINEYATFHRFSLEQRERLHLFTKRMDAVLIEWHRKKHGNK